jgi:outer membrane protein W
MITGRVRRIAVALTLLVSTPVATHAQGAQDGVTIYGYGTFGTLHLAASRTFDAVSGSSRTTSLGAGIQLTGFWKGLLLDAAWSRTAIEGERIAIDDDATFPLGIPLRVTMQPLDIAGGWRSRYGRWSPYGGIGISRLLYEETSDGNVTAEDLATSSIGPLILGGLDFRISRFVLIGGELRYRHLGGVLGSAGASAAFDERAAGGWTVGARMSVGR